eukprot:TRINITY_DN4434_c0_g1_i2.p1 TRINITY_DN4434_c0_g1~~TRINITY_DN4434_c0_g1_i2.p1  ORF type:complete len:104 (-),score=13.48 TRINITY_DN4434_c0_g1_i2:49-360(-)
MGHGHQPNEKIDVYSFGVILWQMIMGKVPFEGLSQIEVGVGIQNGSLSLLSSLPNENYPTLSDLVSKCLGQASERPSFGVICNILQELEDRTFHYNTTPNTDF